MFNFFKFNKTVNSKPPTIVCERIKKHLEEEGEWEYEYKPKANKYVLSKYVFKNNVTIRISLFDCFFSSLIELHDIPSYKFSNEEINYLLPLLRNKIKEIDNFVKTQEKLRTDSLINMYLPK